MDPREFAFLLLALALAEPTAPKTAAGSSAEAPALHGAQHPTVHVDVANLECLCDLSDSTGARCMTNGAELIVSLRGVIPGVCAGYRYELLVEDLDAMEEQGGRWRAEFSCGRTFHVIRVPLAREEGFQGRYVGADYKLTLQDSSGELFAFGPLLVLDSDTMSVQITVLDLHPDLTRDEALIGQRTVEFSHVKCANPEGYDLRDAFALQHRDQPFEEGVHGVIQEASGYFSLVGERVVHIECNPAMIPDQRCGRT